MNRMFQNNNNNEKNMHTHNKFIRFASLLYEYEKRNIRINVNEAVRLNVAFAFHVQTIISSRFLLFEMTGGFNKRSPNHIQIHQQSYKFSNDQRHIIVRLQLTPYNIKGGSKQTVAYRNVDVPYGL